MAKAGRKPKKKPVSLAGAAGRIVEIVKVDDPFDPVAGKPIEVMRAVNHSPLVYLMQRDRLHGPGETRKDADARVRAGTTFQGLYERAGGRGAGAIDYSRVKVDVSMHYSGTPEAQAMALSELGAIRKAVGEADYGMLHAVCCEQVPFMVWVNSQWPGAGRQTRLDAYERLRLGLDGLIRYFGVAIGGRSQIRADRMILSTGEEIMA